MGARCAIDKWPGDRVNWMWTRCVLLDETKCRFPIQFYIVDVRLGFWVLGLQEYNVGKKVERFYKSLQYEGSSISSVDPKLYSQRFSRFIISTFPDPDSVGGAHIDPAANDGEVRRGRGWQWWRQYETHARTCIYTCVDLTCVYMHVRIWGFDWEWRMGEGRWEEEGVWKSLSGMYTWKVEIEFLWNVGDCLEGLGF